MGRARWIANRRYSCRKSRALGHSKDACFESDASFASLPCFQCEAGEADANGYHTKFPCMDAYVGSAAPTPSLPCCRGGAGGAGTTARKRNEKLLEGLTQLLAHIDTNDPVEHENEEDDIVAALECLIQNRPRNLLQELKSLVQRFSRPPATSQSVSYADIARRNVTINTGKGKGQGKGHGKGKAHQTPHEWQTVTRKKRHMDQVTKPYQKTKDAFNTGGTFRPSDWGADVAAAYSPDEMEKVAAAAKNKLLLIPRDEDSAMEMWTMLSAFPDKKVTMILPEDADETSFEYDTSVTLTIAKVPCVFQGIVRMTKVRLLMNGAEAPSFVQKTFEIKEQPQNTRTCVVRASINQYVTKDFTMIQKNPGGSCRAWLKAAEIDSKHLGDTWAWQQQGKCITGLLRLDKTAISALLRQSGASHAGHRWFFEPLRHGDHLPAPYDALPETVWIENNGRTLEEVSQAATKEAAKTGMGLKLGLRQVGVRQKRASGNGPPQSKVWRAVGVPRGIDVEDLETIMSAAGFASITVLEKFRWRQQSGFAFRASRSDAQDVIQVKYGTADIAVNLQQRKDFARKAAVSLPGEKRVKFTNHGVPKNPKPQESLDVPMGESKDGDQETGKRSAAELAVENKKAKIVSQIAGFNEIENEGKGDCLFASLSQGLAKQGVAKSTLQCRIQAVTDLRKYCDAYKGHWDGCYPKQQDEQIPGKNFQTYLDHLAKPGSWGSALEVMATSFTLDKPIFVLRPGQECYVFNKNGKKKPLFIKYENQHYTALIPKNEETHAIDNAIEGPHQGMRGAASAAGTRTSVRQRMAPKSTCTRTTIKQVLKKKAGAGSVTQPASTKTHCGAPDAGSLALSNFEPNASASYGQVDKSMHQLPSRRTVMSRTHAVTTGKESFTWNCDMCANVIAAESKKQLSAKRRNRIYCRHKHVSRSCFHQIRKTYDPIAVIPKPQVPFVGWEGGFCGGALPELGKEQEWYVYQCSLGQLPNSSQECHQPRQPTCIK